MSPRRRLLLAAACLPLGTRSAGAVSAPTQYGAASASGLVGSASGAVAGASGATGSASGTPGRADPAVQRGRNLRFPADHGAHLTARTEWWYITGWLGTEAQPTHGFQITFFRSRTGLAESLPGRFAPRHLLFAHAAWTDLAAGRHQHAERLARWNGDPAAAPDHAGLVDADLQIGRWRLWRESTGAEELWRCVASVGPVALDLRLAPQQPLLLQGDAGYSRKGPDERQASHYVSLPQLAALQAGGAKGRAWLDHEWSDELLHADAVGWDWVGINLFDGSALTAFRLRRADGSVLWAGGSWRAAGSSAVRNFNPQEVQWQALERWSSPATGANYPVHWALQTPAGRHGLRALLAPQELDARLSTGTVYWEGLSELLDAQGRRIGLGYLEMTGYAGRLRLG